MISKTIKIGDKEVCFASSAGTLKRYRDMFGGDLLAQLSKITSDNPDIDLLSQLAYVMAVQGGETQNYLEWLDNFEMVEFVTALTEVVAIWGLNTKTTISPKKK